MVLQEEDLSRETLLKAVSHLSRHRSDYIKAMEGSPQTGAADTIFGLIEDIIQ